MWRPSRRGSVVRTTQGKAPHFFKSASGQSRLFRRPPRIPRLQAQHRDCTVGPLKGRWLKTLVDTYVNGVRPPDNTIGIFEQGVIRHCMVGKGLTADETRAVIKNLR